VTGEWKTLTLLPATLRRDGGYGGDRGGGYGDRRMEDSDPPASDSSQRPKLNLLPRTVKAPVADRAPTSGGIFGEGKPRDERKFEK